MEARAGATLAPALELLSRRELQLAAREAGVKARPPNPEPLLEFGKKVSNYLYIPRVTRADTRSGAITGPSVQVNVSWQLGDITPDQWLLRHPEVRAVRCSVQCSALGAKCDALCRARVCCAHGNVTSLWAEFVGAAQECRPACLKEHGCLAQIAQSCVDDASRSLRVHRFAPSAACDDER